MQPHALARHRSQLWQILIEKAGAIRYAPYQALRIMEVLAKGSSPSQSTLLPKRPTGHPDTNFRARTKIMKTKTEEANPQFNVGSEVDRNFDDSSLSNGGNPRIVILMGGPAAGKTTIRRQQYSTGYVLVDAAEIFLSLCRGEYFDFPGPFEELLDEIGPLVARRAIIERRHIVTELIGHEIGPIKDLADAMRAVGYQVNAQVITCDIDEALRRNANRGDDNISAYYAERFQRAWLHDVALSVRDSG